jgi:hypothetical protein
MAANPAGWVADAALALPRNLCNHFARPRAAARCRGADSSNPEVASATSAGPDGGLTGEPRSFNPPVMICGVLCLVARPRSETG